jgi:hypothetical protein
MLAEIRPLGQEIDRMYAIREEIRELKAQQSEKQKQLDALETEVMARLEADGTMKATGMKATVAITEKVVPKVQDWEAFTKYIRRMNYFHLFERRVSAAAYRELMAGRKQAIPGVEPYTIRELSLRTAA